MLRTDPIAVADHPHAELVMAAHGFYDQHAQAQASVGALAIERFASEARRVAIARPTVTIADYGAATGGNSKAPILEAIGALRERTHQPITVLHTDLPGNDFPTLFQTINDPELGYVSSHHDVYPAAIGCSFYDQLMPSQSVELGWSSITTHWLSRSPTADVGPLTDVRADAELSAAHREQAEVDWFHFLAARTAELVLGGTMVMVEPCSHPDGDNGGEGCSALMRELLRDLITAGTIGADEVGKITLRPWMRQPEEYFEPLRAHPDLSVLHAQVIETPPNPIEDEFHRTGDVRRFAQEFTAATRAWSEGMLFGHLSHGDQVADEYFRRFEALVTADPRRLESNIHYVMMVFAREG